MIAKSSSVVIIRYSYVQFYCLACTFGDNMNLAPWLVTSPVQGKQSNWTYRLHIMKEVLFVVLFQVHTLTLGYYLCIKMEWGDNLCEVIRNVLFYFPLCKLCLDVNDLNFIVRINLALWRFWSKNDLFVYFRFIIGTVKAFKRLQHIPYETVG